MQKPTFLIRLMPLLLCVSCATVPLPLQEIPQKENAFKGAIAAGWNGLNLNAAYATKKIPGVLSLSYQHQLFTSSQMLDLGLGMMPPNRNFLAMVTAGYGRQDISPWSNGVAGQINHKYGHVTRFGGYLMVRLFDVIHFGLRLSFYEGTMDYHLNGSYHYGRVHTKRFSSVGIEPWFYTKFGHFFCGGGGHRLYESYRKKEPLFFDPWPLWIVLGYTFSTK